MQERFWNKRADELQTLHDSNDFGGLFAVIREERWYSMGIKSAVNTPTLEQFVLHFQNLLANDGIIVVQFKYLESIEESNGNRGVDVDK